MYILDTDHFTLLARGHAEIAKRVLIVDPAKVAISIVTVEEVLTGWYSALRQAKDVHTEIKAYSGLFASVQAFKTLEVIPFTPAAVHQLHNFRKQYRRLGRMDLAIATIAIDNNAILVTRNRSDFEQISGLMIEDWSQP